MAARTIRIKKKTLVINNMSAHGKKQTRLDKLRLKFGDLKQSVKDRNVSFAAFSGVLTLMTVYDLRKIAKSAKIPEWYKMNKSDLKSAIMKQAKRPGTYFVIATVILVSMFGIFSGYHAYRHTRYTKEEIKKEYEGSEEYKEEQARAEKAGIKMGEELSKAWFESKARDKKD